MDRYIKWFAMPIGEQISNIGSEVERAIRFKRENREDRMLEHLNKALELIDRTQKDPKNRWRIGELGFCREELIDYFIGENIYNTKPEDLQKYYNAFL